MIGYYVHHHGSGHLHRAGAIAAHLEEPVTVLSSLPVPPSWTGPWVHLPRDDDPPAREVAPAGRLHWAPVDHAGLRTRMAAVARWIEQATPSVLVVDVSVEIAVLARLMGVRVAYVVLPGDRTDAPHRMAFDLADLLIRCSPAEIASDVTSYESKTIRTGAFSRFDQRRREPHDADGERRAVLLFGNGGSDVSAADVTALVEATDDWSWDLLGAGFGRTDDPWPLLRRADVVVASAGQNAVAEIAAARVPAVIVAQERPFREQHATVAALRSLGLGPALDAWPEADAWPDLLEDAVRRPGADWERWAPGDGAPRAAAAIATLARRAS